MPRATEKSPPPALSGKGENRKNRKSGGAYSVGKGIRSRGPLSKSKASNFAKSSSAIADTLSFHFCDWSHGRALFKSRL